MAEMSPLRRRMVEDMTVRKSVAGDAAIYVSAVAKFSRHFGCSPDRLGLEEVRAFQVHLVAGRDLLAGAEPDRLRAAVLLRRDTRPGDHARAHPVCPRTPQAAGRIECRRGGGLPGSGAEPEEPGRADHAYAAGLRTSEVVGLRVEDVDSARGVISVRCGKGGKDRHVMLSPQLLGILRTYWRLARPPRYLFPGGVDDHPLSTTVLHAACRSLDDVGAGRLTPDEAQTISAIVAKRAELFPSIELAAEIDALKAQLAAIMGAPRQSSPIRRPYAIT